MKFIPLLSKFISRNQFLHFGFLLTIINIFGGILGYIYQITMGRILQQNEFALFSTIMALYTFFSAPMAAISLLIVRKVSVIKARNNLYIFKSFFLYIHKLLLLISVFIFIFFWTGSSYFQQYFKVDTYLPLILFTLIFISSLFTTACMSFLQGLQSFILMGSFGFLGLLGKLFFGVIFVTLGFGINGAIFGILLAHILIYILANILIFKVLPQQDLHRKLSFDLSDFKNFVSILIATISIAAMTQLDIVLINFYFPTEQTANYAAASVLGKAVLYLPSGLILVLFPMVSENHEKGKSSFRLFCQAVFVTLIVCGSISCIYWVFGNSLIDILYGHKYNEAGQILQWYGFAILPFTIVLLAEQYLIAMGKILFAWIFLTLLPLKLLVIHFFHSDIYVILFIFGIFGSLMAIIGFALMWYSAKYN